MTRLRYKLGWLLIPALALLPLVQWAYIMPLAARFVDGETALNNVGRILGIFGIALLSLNFVLAARLSFYEDLFDGLPNVYKAHQIFGSLALIVLLLHPLFLLVSYLDQGPGVAFRFLLPLHSWPTNLGVVALYLFTVLLILTLYIKLPYNLWKMTHKLLGLAFILAGLHALFQPGEVAQNQNLTITLGVFMGAAILAIIYRVILVRLLAPAKKYRVEASLKVAPEILEMTLSPIKKALKFAPGQFVFMRFLERGIPKEAHPYTIVSAPSEPKLRFAIKMVGAYTRKLEAMPDGALAAIEGPFGRFSYQTAQFKTQVWIAGGIGITPFLAWLRAGLDPFYSINLFYSAATKAELAFLPELEKLALAHPNLKIFAQASSDSGHITAEAIRAKSGDLKDKDYFLCGPAAMIESISRQLRTLGVKKSRLQSEDFSFV